MTNDTTYVHRRHRVAAIRWTGNNFAEVEAFLINNLGEDCGPRTTFYATSGDYVGYSIVQFTAWGDDREVDEGWWIVINLDDSDPGGDIICDFDFRADYEAAAVGASLPPTQATILATLRIAAGWYPYPNDVPLAKTAYVVENWRPSPSNLTCPMCEEIDCDAGCPFTPLRHLVEGVRMRLAPEEYYEAAAAHLADLGLDQADDRLRAAVNAVLDLIGDPGND